MPDAFCSCCVLKQGNCAKKLSKQTSTKKAVPVRAAAKSELDLLYIAAQTFILQKIQHYENVKNCIDYG